MGSGFGAGAGADMLQEVLKQKFEQALAMQQMKLAQQRLSDENTRFYSGQDFQAGQNKLGREFTHGENESAHTFTHGENEAGRTFTHGENEAGRTFTHGENEAAHTFTAGENKAGREFTGGQNAANRQNALKIVGIQGQNALNVARERPAPTVLVQTTDDNGNPITKIVPKVAGGEYDKGPGATTEARLQSAKAVTQTGNDIITALKDPKVAAMLGPAMSRYNSVADFVGNPPPEFAKLAGQIESYSLANMGVHGMRSANGAEAIKQTVGAGRHTPESMIATLEGLNGFANHLLENNHRGDTGGAAGAKNDPLGIR
jgi:hypothetical protein